jgi:hypothetical protein
MPIDDAVDIANKSATLFSFLELWIGRNQPLNIRLQSAQSQTPQQKSNQGTLGAR